MGQFQTTTSLPPLFTLDDLEQSFVWIVELRKEYSSNSDIWPLRRDWVHIKNNLLIKLNDGSYRFGLLDRYEFDDGILSLWPSQDMIALKLITQALQLQMGEHIPKSCYHVKNHGGLKKGVDHTHKALQNHEFVMRSDIKSYYNSIRFDVLMGIVESTIKHPILLTLLHKALRRTETRGGLFYEYYEKGLPMGSPLSPLLGAIALIPLDNAMSQIKGIFYARFMDDWVVLTKSKTALRKIVKITHKVLNSLKLELHPNKTYIGKISHGFNFLGYYMDDQKILPSKETLRRCFERATALYEHPQGNGKGSRRSKKKTSTGRDTSNYQVNEPAPTDGYFKNILENLLELSAQRPDSFAVLRRYIGRWARWLKLGLSTLSELQLNVEAHLPSIFSCWLPGTKIIALGSCH